MNGPARGPLSVVIATRNRPEKLRQCLAALQPVLGPDDEVVVVDSASTDRRTREVADAAGVRVLRADRPGTSLARNLGWRAATHGCVAFIDDDVVVEPGWADAMARALSAPEATWVTGWIGLQQHDSGATELNPTMLATEPAVLDDRHRGTMGASANFGARRAVMAEVGGFDERFGPGRWTAAAEDVELFDRLVALGRPGRYDPAVRVFHEQWRGRRDGLMLQWRYGKGMGARLALLLRRDRGRAARSAYEVVWADGLHAALRCFRARYEFGTALALLRVAGTAVGFVAWLGRRSR